MIAAFAALMCDAAGGLASQLLPVAPLVEQIPTARETMLAPAASPTPRLGIVSVSQKQSLPHNQHQQQQQQDTEQQAGSTTL